MRCEEFVADLMDRLEEGRAPASTPQAKAHLDSCRACRRDAAELPRLWQRLAAADPAGEVPSTRLKQRFEASLDAVLAARELPGRDADATRATEGRVIKGRWSGVLGNRGLATAMAATLALGIAVGFFAGGYLSTSAEVRELRAAMRSTNEVLAVALMSHDSAGERLRGITLASGGISQSSADGARLVEALLDRVRNDPNDNVRVAAVEALESAVDLAEVREGLSSSIAAQQSPEVQAVVLETLARADRGAVDQVLTSGQLDIGVRQWFQVVVPTYVG